MDTPHLGEPFVIRVSVTRLSVATNAVVVEISVKINVFALLNSAIETNYTQSAVALRTSTAAMCSPRRTTLSRR